MKSIGPQSSIDASAEADDYVQIEVQKELGFKDCYKLYVHVNGQTILRICKLKRTQLFRTGWVEEH